MASSSTEAEAFRPARSSTAAALALHLQRLDRNGAPILGALDFVLEDGETVAIAGPSGIGKTTFLRSLAGLEPGLDGDLRPARRLAMVFQEPCLLPWRDAQRNLTLTTGISLEQARAALDEVGLGNRAGHRPAEMSLGQQRRLALARAFAIRPTALLMDEPFVSLDPDTADQMMDLFCQLRDAYGVATVLVTHDRREAERLADRVLTLDGTPARFTA